MYHDHAFPLPQLLPDPCHPLKNKQKQPNTKKKYSPLHGRNIKTETKIYEPKISKIKNAQRKQNETKSPKTLLSLSCVAHHCWL